MGSMWGTGFRVSRPGRAAVSSPSRHADHAWKNSWNVRESKENDEVQHPLGMRALSNAKASQGKGFFSSPGWPVNADGGRSLPSGPACAGALRPSRARVEPVIQPLHVAAVHVRVDLRRRHVRVTEHLLHRAEVRSALEQVGRRRWRSL